MIKRLLDRLFGEITSLPPLTNGDVFVGEFMKILKKNHTDDQTYSQ